MASKLHNRVKRLIKEILGTSILEEINVNKLFPNYPAKNQHYDLVIPSYNLIIECHGEQHYKLQTFGEKDISKAVYNFQKGQHRDRRKEEVVWENGWGYVSIAFNELPKDDEEAKKIIKGKLLKSISEIENE